MPLLVSCPSCKLEGELPDDISGGILACPRCGAEFSPPQADLPSSFSPTASDELAVWVGSGLPPAVTPPPTKGLSADVLAAVPGIDPPLTITPENAAQHAEWLQREAARFNAHVSRQLELIRQTREDFAGQEARAAAALVTREMELNRARAELAARNAAIDQREAELAEEREQLARRAETLDRMEAAIQRRLQEVDELEELLRGELEQREREIERQRRTVEEVLREIKSRSPVSSEPSNLLDSLHCG